MDLLATYWLPPLDPIEPSSVWPVVLVVILVALGAPRVTPGVRDRGNYIAPAALFLAAQTCPGSLWAGRNFPGLAEHLGYILLIASGVGFGLRLIRRGSHLATSLGATAVMAFGTLVIIDAVLKWHGAWNLYYGGTELWVHGLAALALTWPMLIAAMWGYTRHVTRARRSDRLGQCPACGYDLRGSGGRACPECGAERKPAT